MDAFRDFVSRYPKLRDDVVSGKRTWQSIYEDWVIMEKVVIFGGIMKVLRVIKAGAKI